jgi:hypothetical protein
MEAHGSIYQAIKSNDANIIFLQGRAILACSALLVKPNLKGNLGNFYTRQGQSSRLPLPGADLTGLRLHFNLATTWPGAKYR